MICRTRRTSGLPAIRRIPLLATTFALMALLNACAENLVPSSPGSSPNYYCTWAAQNYMEGQGEQNFDCSRIEGSQGNQIAQGWIRESTVFGTNGWSELFHPKARGDLYFMFDDGAFANWSDNSFMLDVEYKFPSYAGGTYQDQWKHINDDLKANGWRSLAIWCRGPESQPQPLLWSLFAGVDYWKIDGGNFSQDLRDTYHPDLLMELMPSYSSPMNGDWRGSGRFGSQSWSTWGTVGLIQVSDIVRTYDVTPALSVATTIDRIAELLKAVGGHTEVTCLMNVEDEVYVAAGLGCLMGVMRQPLTGLRSPDCDLFFMGPRQVKKRMDEVARAVRWQRIAPAFAAGRYATTLSTKALTDSWHFTTGETWFSEVINNTAYQGASACVTRGLPLPTVNSGSGSDDDLPFVLASGYPNGAVSVATIGRTKPDNGWYSPEVDIVLDVGSSSGPFGIFGHYRSLRLDFDQPVGSLIVLAQDLAGDNAVDITSRITISSNSITIPGSVVAEIGLSAATPGDLSDPGMVLALQTVTDARPMLPVRATSVVGSRVLTVSGQKIIIPRDLAEVSRFSISLLNPSGKMIADITDTGREVPGIADGVYIAQIRRQR